MIQEIGKTQVSLVGLTAEEKKKKRKRLMGTSQGTRKCCGFKVTGPHSLCWVPLIPRESLCLCSLPDRGTHQVPPCAWPILVFNQPRTHVCQAETALLVKCLPGTVRTWEQPLEPTQKSQVWRLLPVVPILGGQRVTLPQRWNRNLERKGS